MRDERRSSDSTPRRRATDAAVRRRDEDESELAAGAGEGETADGGSSRHASHAIPIRSVAAFPDPCNLRAHPWSLSENRHLTSAAVICQRSATSRRPDSLNNFAQNDELSCCFPQLSAFGTALVITASTLRALRGTIVETTAVGARNT